MYVDLRQKCGEVYSRSMQSVRFPSYQTSASHAGLDLKRSCDVFKGRKRVQKRFFQRSCYPDNLAKVYVGWTCTHKCSMLHIQWKTLSSNSRNTYVHSHCTKLCQPLHGRGGGQEFNHSTWWPDPEVSYDSWVTLLFSPFVHTVHRGVWPVRPFSRCSTCLGKETAASHQSCTSNPQTVTSTCFRRVTIHHMCMSTCRMASHCAFDRSWSSHERLHVRLQELKSFLLERGYSGPDVDQQFA